MPCSCNLSAVAKICSCWRTFWRRKVLLPTMLGSNLRFLEIPGIPKILCWSTWSTDAPKASRAFDALMKQLASKVQGWLMQRKSNAASSPKTPKMIKNRWYIMIVLQFLHWKGTRPFVLEFAVQCQSPTSVGSHRIVGLVPWVGGWRHWRPGRPAVCVENVSTKNLAANSQVTDVCRQSLGNSLRQIHLVHFCTNPHPCPLSHLFKLIHSHWLYVVAPTSSQHHVCHGLKLQDD